QRTDFPFNDRRRLLCRTTKCERSIRCMKIERGRNRRGDSFGRRELFGWIDDSHPDKRAANTLLNVLLPDQFFFDLIWALKCGEVVRRPDCGTGGFKSYMISLFAPRGGSRTGSQPC